MIRQLFASIVAIFVCGGCIHYGVESSQISLSGVPAKVSKAFFRNFPDVNVKNVRQHTFKGKIVSYEFEYFTGSEQIGKVGITSKGELIVGGNQPPIN